MTVEEEKRVEEKLAKFAEFRPITLEGWEGYYKAPEGVQVAWTCYKPDFLHDFNACIKWIMPKVPGEWIQVLRRKSDGKCFAYLSADIGRGFNQYKGEAGTLAMAFCLSVEKFIEEVK